MPLAPAGSIMAAIWKGAIGFGLVNVPIELRAAVRSDHISFRLLHGKDNTPVKYERVREDDGKSVAWEDIVKGYEYEKDQYVVLTDDDFRTAALERSESIEITDFVDADDIDPRYFDTPYFAVPTGKPGRKAYAVLREAMRQANVVGIGTVILRRKQHLAGLHVAGDALVLEIMRFANEIVAASEYDFPSADDARPQEIEMAQKLVESLHGPFEPEKYVDVYRENLLRIIEARARGKKVQLRGPRRPTEDAKVLDLMAKLEASLKQARDRDDEAKPAAKRSRRSAAGSTRRKSSSTRRRERRSA
jgi:DNA end-binding protein Ku